MGEIIITSQGDQSFYLLCAYLCCIVGVYSLVEAKVLSLRYRALLKLSRFIKVGKVNGVAQDCKD